MVDQQHRDFALGLIDFLQTSISNGVIDSDDADSVEVAIDCLTDVFGVDMKDKENVYGNSDLFSIFNVYSKLRERQKLAKSLDNESQTTSPNNNEDNTSSQTSSTTTSTSTPREVSTEDKEKAEKLKLSGNAALQKSDYQNAISFYTQAIELDPTNTVYFSNRAAAYSTSQQYDKAVSDARTSISLDPSYAKGYSRLGMALLSLGDSPSALEAYEKGLKVEGSNPSDMMRKGYEAAQKKMLDDLEDAISKDTEKVEQEKKQEPEKKGEEEDASTTRETSNANSIPGLASIASLMNNPELQKMAKNFISDPNAFSNIINNPQIQKMAESFKGVAGAGGKTTTTTTSSNTTFTSSGTGSTSSSSTTSNTRSGTGTATEGDNGAGINNIANNLPSVSDILSNPAVQHLAQSFLNGYKK